MITEENVTSNDINDNQEVQETQPQVENNQTQETEKFDYRKARDERIARNTEKRILKDLGAESIDEVKTKLKESIETQKQLFKECENGKKLCAFREGIDKQFVDYVVYTVSKNLKEGEKFEDAIKKFAKDNCQFVNSTPKVKFSSSPDLENNRVIKFNGNRWMNNFLRGKNKNNYL